MTRRQLTAALFLATTPLFAQTDFTPPKSYGPWWVNSSRPGPQTRPAKIDRDEVAMSLGTSAPPMGVQVWFWGDVAELKKGDRYELRYQLRVHTKKGEVGPLLGDAAHPNGVAYPVAAAAAAEDWFGLEGAVDVTRKDLTAATRLPLPPKDKQSHTVFLRVEPQLYDATADKYLTPAKSTAVILAVSVWHNGKVWDVEPLGDWLSKRAATADDALAAVAELDEYDPTTSGLEAGILKVLGSDSVKADVKAKFVAAVPAARVNWKQNANLKRALEGFADGADETLKAAAKKKLGEK